jgi:hypothetical protein
MGTGKRDISMHFSSARRLRSVAAAAMTAGVVWHRSSRSFG